jgi:RNA polymerase sigma factor (sigma-70 family)
MDESAVLKSAKKLEHGALVGIFDIYAPVVCRYCFRLSRDSVESDSLVGTVFSRLLENPATGDSSVGTLKTYIFQITYQTMSARNGSGNQPTPMRAISAEAQQSGATLERSDDQSQTLSLILSEMNSDLTAIDRHVLLLRCVEDFSLNETAFIVGKGTADVEIIQNHALATLRKLLGLNLGDQHQFTANLEM